MTDDRRRHSRALPLGQERAERLGQDVVRSAKAARPMLPIAAREPQRVLYCEIDGLPVQLDRAELSGAGLFVLTPQPLPVDSEIAIFLRIEEQPFEMSGHVVKSLSCAQAEKTAKQPGYALLFTNLDDGERKRLARAVHRLRAASSTPPTQPRTPLAQPKPPGRATAPHDPAELALLEQLRSELMLLGDKPAWAVLGVSQGADRASVRAAFFQASKRYHPHLFARYAHPEIKRVVTELFIAHKRAYTTMTRANKSMRASRP